KWKSWHDVMVKGLGDNRFLPIGFSRPDDNLLPFLAELDGSGIVADMIVEVMVGEENPKAEAERAQKRAEEPLAQLNFQPWSGPGREPTAPGGGRVAAAGAVTAPHRRARRLSDRLQPLAVALRQARLPARAGVRRPAPLRVLRRRSGILVERPL